MSAEQTDSILDLLYGELSEDEERDLLAELDDTPELRAEYDELDAFLGDLREAMPIEDVSPSIHASIMDAARKAAEQAPEEGRMIRQPTKAKTGWWSRMGGGQASQIALVAAVLIAGLFVVRAVDRSESPLHGSASNISTIQEAAPAMAAMADEEAKPADGPESEELLDGAGAENEAVAVTDQWSNEPGARASAAAQAPADAVEPPPVAEPKPEPTPDRDDDIARSLRNELAKSSRQDAVVPKAETRRRAPTKKRSKGTTKKAPSTSSSVWDEPIGTKSKDGNLTADLLAGDRSSGFGGESSTSSSTAPKAAEAPAPAPVQAQSEAEESQQAREYRARQNTISSVQTYFRSGDYGGAIRAADEFLAQNKSASATEKATALHVKAQSLERQGKYSEADRIYSSLQKNYPGYQSGAIDNARKEIRRKNVKKPKRKSKRKADTIEDSYAPTEMME